MSRDVYREASIEALLDPAREGDQGALAELLRRSQPILDRIAKEQRLARARLGMARPSDIAQETMQRALQKIERFKGASRGEWEQWLRAIFVNCLKQAYRAAHQLKRDADATVPLEEEEIEGMPGGEESPSQWAAQQEEQRRLVARLSRLPPGQGEAIMHVCLYGRTHAEASRAMKRTEAAVRGLVGRGLKALLANLDPDAEEPVDEAVDEVEPSPADEAEIAFLSYLRGQTAGEAEAREALLAAHPTCAGELRAMFDLEDRLRALWAASPDAQGPRG